MLDSNFYGTWYRKFALKPLAQAGCFEYHKPHKQLSYKGPIWTIMRFPLSQICQTTPKLLRQVFYIMYHENHYQAYWKVHFLIFQHTLLSNPRVLNLQDSFLRAGLKKKSYFGNFL